jgi:hypothetical protein
MKHWFRHEERGAGSDRPLTPAARSLWPQNGSTIRLNSEFIRGILATMSLDRPTDMDQATVLPTHVRQPAVDCLSDFLVHSVESARAVDQPFFHLELERVFPDDDYAQILTLMPEASDYRPMHGRSKGHDLADGTHTRVKIDLFPEYIRNLPPKKRDLWGVVGRALCSLEVKRAFIRRLAPGLSKRFGKNFAGVGMYPVPVLTRDVPGYLITPHTDTRWKGITVQLYLPKDDANTDVGTIFHQKLPDGSLPKKAQMRFARNTGYAFAVGDDTWHSAEVVHNRIETRDSILLTFFVDRGPLRILRNRGKRVGNFVVNEIRQIWR